MWYEKNDSRSINLDPRSVDVNVHPTKREVHFLNEEAIIERISDAIQQKLAGQSQSRVFEYQVHETINSTDALNTFIDRRCSLEALHNQPHEKARKRQVMSMKWKKVTRADQRMIAGHREAKVSGCVNVQGDIY